MLNEEKAFFFIFIFFLAMGSCNWLFDKVRGDNFEEPFNHPGSKNYAVKTIIPKSYNSYSFEQDTIGGHIYVNKAFEPEDRNYYTNELLKIDRFGNIVSSYNGTEIRNGGTIIEDEYYSNWVINGDTTKFSYITIDTSEHTSMNSFMKRFTELYNGASVFYWDYFNCYFKYNKKWIQLKEYQHAYTDSLEKVYPEFGSQQRMVYLKDRTPSYFTKPHLKNAKLLDEFGISIEYRKDTWYITITTTYREKINLKWMGGSYLSPKLRIYQIRNGINSRKDVLFLRSMEKYGLYVVQPRDSLQPEAKFKDVVFESKDGKKFLNNYEETESYIQWKSKKE